MKTLLFLIESLSGGGAEKVLSTLIKHLDNQKFKITLCCILNVGPFLNDVKPYVKYHSILPDPDRLTALPLLFYKIKYKLIYSWLSPRLIYRIFIPKGNDVEIAFIEGNATRILAGSTNKKSRKIAWVHTDVSINKGDHLLKESYLHFDQVVAVSQATKRAFIELLPDMDSRAVVIYNPIDRCSILRGSIECGYIPNQKKGVPRLVSVGRLVSIKAFDRLLRVAHRLQEENVSFELWILGDGPERKNLSNYIDRHGMGAFVHLWGFLRNPYAYMSKCDLFVCSSLAEGFSTAATEALVLGLPIVTTDCAGMKELLGDDYCGIIVDNNEEALYLGIKMVLNDSALLDKMKDAAKRRGACFSIESLMPPLESFLEHQS